MRRLSAALRPMLRTSRGVSVEARKSTAGELVEMPTQTAATVDRYGRGDRVVKLSLSGTKFLTLRSTLAHSAVLDDIVTRAEANEASRTNTRWRREVGLGAL
ncbi:BCAT2 [Symbiodinium natans]|uniref:BCAT2 protein n=1 Tax=Symbiodinium natans TaxID=878477 RepID=A0A812PBD6_9DINO|nr:BCAT2 [Symbiodinium natans]